MVRSFLLALVPSASPHSQVDYLCWHQRRVIDAAFLGDLAVMARHITRVQPLPASRSPSRGIVLSAGGQQYAANAFVNIYVLQRFLNCTLPVAFM